MSEARTLLGDGVHEGCRGTLANIKICENDERRRSGARRTLRVRGDLERHDRQVDDADVLGPVHLVYRGLYERGHAVRKQGQGAYLELRVHDSALVLWEHGQAAARIYVGTVA